MISGRLESEIVATPQEQDDIVLSIRGVSKKFCRNLKRALFYAVIDVGAEILGIRNGKDRILRKDEFWALDDINFELRKGDAIGLVGANGAGKTTMLKIITGLIKPDKGSVRTVGRVAPLIALGAGFNPILSGRENIFVNMSILGLTRKQIKERFNDVVEFAEIGDAIDSPVQTYSSGMSARLGFACAVHTDPDILLIDEVLAVGDLRFRLKCYRKLSSLKQKGVSFILVSHNSQSVLSICEHGVYFKKGRLKKIGDIRSVVSEYETDLIDSGRSSETTQGVLKLPRKNPNDTYGIEIRYLCFKDWEGKLVDQPETGSDVFFCIGIDILKAYEDFFIMVAFDSSAPEVGRVLHMTSKGDQVSFNAISGQMEVKILLKSLGLIPGLYFTKVNVMQDPISALDSVDSFRFVVKSNKQLVQNTYFQQREWRIEPVTPDH